MGFQSRKTKNRQLFSKSVTPFDGRHHRNATVTFSASLRNLGSVFMTSRANLNLALKQQGPPLQKGSFYDLPNVIYNSSHHQQQPEKDCETPRPHLLYRPLTKIGSYFSSSLTFKV